MRYVQVFFANRIYKLRKEVERWKQRGTSGSYSYWYNRREGRAKQNMNETISMVNKYLQPPFQPELINSVEAALKVDPYLSDISRALNHSELARVILDRQLKSTVKKNSGRISNEPTYYS
jgi:predicted RNA-binding protein with EMAP domain